MTDLDEQLVAEALRATFFKPFEGLEADACWLWPRKPNAQGYGRICVNRRTCLAHRIAWLIGKGEIPAGLCVLHTCDVRLCVNTNHHFLGTKGDNARDMAMKGRQWLQQHPEKALRGDAHPARLNPATLTRGERHHMTTLTAEQVIAIREAVAAGSKKRPLAIRFNVSDSCIAHIAVGETWGHIGGPLTPLRAYKRSRLEQPS